MKIMCIGQAAYDITFMMDEFPKENLKYRVHDRIVCGGGSASNAAYLLGKWGCDVSFLGIVGNDYYGKKIRDEFRTVNVNIDNLEFSQEYETPTSYIIVNKENGSRTILTHRNKNMKMNDANINIKPDIIMIDGREDERSLKLIEENPGSIVVIDAGNTRKEVLDLCKLSNYVVCSKVFAEEIGGAYINDLNTLNICLTKLENEFNTNVIITLEEMGCGYRNELGKAEIINAFKSNVLDTTGAGDIFHGAFVYGLTKKWDMKKILMFSNITAALSVTKIGGRNSVFDIKEVEEIYNEIK